MFEQSPAIRSTIFTRALCCVGLVVATAACDTGDGTTMQAPSTPTTLPPPDTTPLASVAIEPPPLPTNQLPGSDVPVTPPENPTPGQFRLFAPWAEGGPIDTRYSCVGSNVSPAMSWADVPDGTAELAVGLFDETNLSNGEPFIHWIMGGLDAGPESTSLGEGEIPIGAFQALNFFGDVGYAGPCPNPDATNTYRLTLFALNQQLEVADGTPATELLDLINTVAIGTVSVTGTSTR